MITYYKDDELQIDATAEPIITVRAYLPKDTKGVKQEKKQKPYLLNNSVDFEIYYNKFDFILRIPKNYTWDGASIPFLFRPIIGKKGSLEFLLPSMVHDKLCENPHLIDYNRKLSSKIFRALLISTGVGKFRANIMYHAVDNFQKFKSWR